MKLVIYLSLCLLGLVRLAEASRPRGVRAELASMYNPNQDFKCFDGSNVIPFNHINDDYCDCQVRPDRILSCCLSHSSLLSLRTAQTSPAPRHVRLASFIVKIQDTSRHCSSPAGYVII